MASPSPFGSRALQRAATFSYALVDEVHSLVDEQPFVPRRELTLRVRRLGAAGLVLFGALVSTLGKLAYETRATGRDGTVRPFTKPWFLTLLMFVGMSLNLPLSMFLDCVRGRRWPLRRWRRKARQAAAPAYAAPLLLFDGQDDAIEAYPSLSLQLPPAGAGAAGRAHAADRQLLLLLLPTALDLVGSALLNVGLLTITASATQMLRQSLLPFAALLGVALLGKRLNALHALGLAGCVLGLGMVAAASVASGFGGSSAPPGRGAMAVGVGLVLASQAVAAGQLLIDQRWQSARPSLSPLKVVGWEGLFGVALTLLVVLPAAGVSGAGAEGWGLSEDSLDSVAMVAGSPLLQALLLAYTGSLQGYNICGMLMLGELSAADTTLLQAVRTTFVWLANLVLYAAAAALEPDAPDQLPAPPPSAALPGEPWLLPWSFLQAAGFAVLVLAATAYGRGDNERRRRQLQDEAALIMADQPPSAAGSVHGAPARPFTAHLDVDTAACLGSLSRVWRERDALYGITPVPSGALLAPHGAGGLAGARSASPSPPPWGGAPLAAPVGWGEPAAALLARSWGDAVLAGGGASPGGSEGSGGSITPPPRPPAAEAAAAAAAALAGPRPWLGSDDGAVRVDVGVEAAAAGAAAGAARGPPATAAGGTHWKDSPPFGGQPHRGA